MLDTENRKCKIHPYQVCHEKRNQVSVCVKGNITPQHQLPNSEAKIPQSTSGSLLQYRSKVPLHVRR